MKKIFLYLFVSGLSFGALAQDEIDQLLKGGKADANRLIEGYVSPFLKTFGYGLNQGWYNTAKNHKTLGFDLTVSVSAVYVPNAELFYTVNNAQLTTIRLENTGTAAVGPTASGSVPTVFGPDVTPTYRLTSGGASFSGAPGVFDLKNDLPMQAMPVPMAHLGIGLPKGFDLKFRFVPELDLGDGKFKLFGVGVMHDIKQYIPGVKSLPFDLAGFVGYTSMKLSVGLEATRPDQQGVFETTATTIQGLISKKISVLTFYGGAGYNIATSKLAINGAYDFDNNGSFETVNPVSVKAEASGPRLSAGMRLKLAVFTFHGDYTLQKYNTLTVGFGIAVR
jgi:hypothetical protein